MVLFFNIFRKNTLFELGTKGKLHLKAHTRVWDIFRHLKGH